MINFPCPHCRQPLQIPEQYAGQSGKCNHCGGPITVPQPPLSTSLDALRNVPDERIAPEEFGAYGKAADAQWDDPSEHVAQEVLAHEEETIELPAIPAEILERHRAMQRQRTKKIVAIAAGALLLLILLSPLIYGLMRRPSTAVNEPTRAVAPATPVPTTDSPAP